MGKNLSKVFSAELDGRLSGPRGTDKKRHRLQRGALSGFAKPGGGLRNGLKEYLERVKGMKLLPRSRIDAWFQQFGLFFTPTFSPSPSVLFFRPVASQTPKGRASNGGSVLSSVLGFRLPGSRCTLDPHSSLMRDSNPRFQARCMRAVFCPRYCIYLQIFGRHSSGQASGNGKG